MAQSRSQMGESSTDASQPAESLSEQSPLGWKIFNAFIEGTDISATEDELREFLVKELKVNFSELHSIYAEHLPLILVAYMNNWTGWIYIPDFLAGKFHKQHYFNRFHKYLTHKIKALGNNTCITRTLKSLGEFVKSSPRVTSAPATKKNPEFSPYAISIQCPPQMLNTIVFSNVGDDVIMKQHVGPEWQDLSTGQLVNWPHIEVTFQNQDLCFVRRQATDYVRYLNFLPHECRKSNESIIESVEAINKNRHSYTYRLLDEYVKEYMSALKTIKNITGEKLEQIQTILSQFLEDIRHINVKNTMATNTVVLFRLSKVSFIRNKKLVKGTDAEGEDARVGYCEIITPKVELIMLYFKAQQKDTPYVSFESTDKIKEINSTDLSAVLPHIGYKCTYCRVEFTKEVTKEVVDPEDSNVSKVTLDTKAQLMEHLKTQHKMEQHVRCTVCKKQFDVLNLAACRWRHKCAAANSTSLTVL